MHTMQEFFLNFAAFLELFAASLVCFSIYDRYLQKVLNIYKRQMYNLYICQNPVYFFNRGNRSGCSSANSKNRGTSPEYRSVLSSPIPSLPWSGQNSRWQYHPRGAA